jgi:hypothetical protein
MIAIKKYMDWIQKDADLIAGVIVEHFLVFDCTLKLLILVLVGATAALRFYKEYNKK